MVSTKEECKEFALKLKQETGKFPVLADWLVKNGFPCGSSFLRKLFGNYNNFRDYCGESQLIRIQPITLDWIKSNCIIDSNDCWNWNKQISADGYGKTTKNSKPYSTHRYTYELVNGEIPNGLIIRHKCDNKLCCNPLHLELGTQFDNIKDYHSRKSSSSKITNNIQLTWKVKKFNSLSDRLTFYLQNVNITEKNCFISSLLADKPYQRVMFNGKSYALHRLILANKLKVAYEDIIVARHICNNKHCINPDHLINGTHSDNALDSRSMSNKSKLTIEQVQEIKKELLVTDFSKWGSKTKFDLNFSEKFNVSKEAIKHVRLGTRWKDVI